MYYFCNCFVCLKLFQNKTLNNNRDIPALPKGVKSKAQPLPTRFLSPHPSLSVNHNHTCGFTYHLHHQLPSLLFLTWRSPSTACLPLPGASQNQYMNEHTMYKGVISNIDTVKGKDSFMEVEFLYELKLSWNQFR